jgi:ATP-dependent DNA ligase
MLSRPGRLPTFGNWSFEVKWEGFRAVVSTEEGLRVRSRRGWNPTALVPELEELEGEPIWLRDLLEVCAKLID